MRTNAIGAAALGLVATLATPVAAFWRMSCPGRLVLQRVDPIVTPNKVSGHVHTVSGGNGFSFGMDYAQARRSTCSSCQIKEDLSAYWTPKLYYQAKDGTFEDVPQSGEGNGVTGGMTVYYLQRYSPNSNVLKAFPKDFRMVAGNPFQRSDTGKKAAPGSAISFVCLNYSAGKGSPQTGYLPNMNCADGLRAQVFFPSCWDGVNLDSPDHQSHMAYPIGEYDNGRCPDTHPVRMISIFYEVTYAVDQFAGRWYNPDKHPFVFAQGDPTGYGFHGDFVNGWDVDVLQRATDQCTALSGAVEDCPVFGPLFTAAECQRCRLPSQVDEPVAGVLKRLPGCNLVTSGPSKAPVFNCAQTPIGDYKKYFTDVTDIGYEYAGCARDSTGTRTFQATFDYSSTMTVRECVASCKKRGYSLAGLQYKDQCFCDNEYHGTDREPVPSILGGCSAPCRGNATETCGGSSALSVYQACAPGDCQNALFQHPELSAGMTKRELQKNSRRL